MRWLLSLARIIDWRQLSGIMSLIRGSPCGPAQAPFKMVYNQFVIHLPPSCNSNYLGYISIIFQMTRGFAASCILKSIGYSALRFLV
ncbi:hypothetical protein DVQ84_10595 [Yersinia enterocolitica]|nr:hypothetical protein [Yersinia enterocolitica]QBP98046.1 hypothetical protein YEY1_04015 [Yersinia enterocolitica subsp. palearctica]EKN4927701.1 hypothetical protein [Yersinia enterocolitica]EKN4932809.1 hypothetical protein [Yersinia enterocolitica]EKN5027302.1 hypothetical protein [Yersinia enterocolitica]